MHTTISMPRSKRTANVRCDRPTTRWYRPEAGVAHTLRMTNMESKTQEQVLGTPDQSNWFQVIFEDVNFACGGTNALLVASGGTA
jgi:hypothetical protein